MTTRDTPPAKREALERIRDTYPGTSSMQQCERICAALAQFPLTTFEAMRYLDCYDPRARVMQLRDAGAPIDTHWKTIVTECGQKHRVGLYVFAPRAEAAVAP